MGLGVYGYGECKYMTLGSLLLPDACITPLDPRLLTQPGVFIVLSPEETVRGALPVWPPVSEYPY